MGEVVQQGAFGIDEPLPRARLLVVDGAGWLDTQVRRALGGEHDVVAARTTGEAIARLSVGERFDAILCGGGADALHAHLARRARHLARRVVFVLARGDADLRDYAARTPNARVEDPVDAPSLRDLVRGLLC